VRAGRRRLEYPELGAARLGWKEGRDAAVSTAMTDGMEMSFALLDALLAEGATGR